MSGLMNRKGELKVMVSKKVNAKEEIRCCSGKKKIEGEVALLMQMVEGKE